MTDHVPCMARSAGLTTVSDFCWSGKPCARQLGTATAITMVKAVDNAEQVGLVSVVLPSVQTSNAASCILHADLPWHLSLSLLSKHHCIQFLVYGCATSTSYQAHKALQVESFA